MKVLVFLADGFEEMEAICTIDILRRAEIEVVTVSINGEYGVEGSHGITLEADERFEDAVTDGADALILPGGMPGTLNLKQHQGLEKCLLEASQDGKTLLAAICAAPSVLGGLDLLHGKKATCYPGFEEQLKGAVKSEMPVVRDGNILTSDGPGHAQAFGLAIVEALVGREKAAAVRSAMNF